MSQAASNAMPALLPCPLCAGEARVAKPYGIEAVICRDCHLTITDHDQQSAVSKWNQRPASPVRKVAPRQVQQDRHRFIEAMCMTARHDFGLDKPQGDDFASRLSSGMTERGRVELRQYMATIYDGYIAPAIEEQAQDLPRLQMRTLLKAAEGVLRWIEAKHRPPVREEIPTGAMALVRIDALADLHDAVHGVQEACR